MVLKVNIIMKSHTVELCYQMKKEVTPFLSERRKKKQNKLLKSWSPSQLMSGHLKKKKKRQTISVHCWVSGYKQQRRAII